MNNEQFWQAVLGNLELSLSKPNFTTWFKNTSILNNSGRGVTIGVPNEFTKAWLQNKYHQNILLAIRAVNPEIREIKYEISSSMTVKFAAPQPPEMVEKEREEGGLPANTQPMGNFGGSQLNPKYKFETFIVGTKNELAHAAAMAVAERPGMAYNPLFIYGGVG